MTIQYLHGIELVQSPDDLRSIQTVATSVIGIIGTSPAADTNNWPLNTPILIPGNPMLAQTLDTAAGTLYDALTDIFNLTNAYIVAVRVTEGSTMAETWSNIYGDATQRTGVYAFLSAQQLLGVTPKLLIAPGFTGVRPADGITGITVNGGGSGYDPDNPPAVTITGNGTGATAKAVVVSGSVSAVDIINPGFGYTNATVTIAAPGSGTQATASATFGACKNPVAIALETVANRLRAHVLLDGPNTVDADAVTYRGDFDNRRVKIIDPMPLVWDINTSAYVTKPASPIAAAQQAIMDNEFGCWWDFSNQEIPTIGGVSRPIGFDISDPFAESNYLNQNDICTIIRDNGYRFWGLRTTSSDADWAFWSVSRTADLVDASVANGIKWAMDRPFSKQLLVEIVESINDYLATLKNLGAILGGTATIDPNINSHDQLRQGIVRIEFDREPPAPIEHIILGAHRNAKYYDVLIADVLATLAAA